MASAAVPSTLTVMPTGDSLTNGNGDSVAIADGGYRLPLGTWMLTAPLGCTMHMIGPNDNAFANGQGQHDGQTGVTIQYHITNLPGLLTGSFKAQLLLLLIGTNNCLVQSNVISATLSLEAQLLAACRTANPNIRILMSTLPANQDAIPNSNILGVNAGLASVISTENGLGGHVKMVDGYAACGAYNSTPSDWFDGTHFNEVTGYQKWAAMWQAGLTAALPGWF
jgi:lysophospholipase L1-like esterase